MKILTFTVIVILLVCGTVLHAKIPDEILAKKTAVVTIYIQDKEEVIAFGSGFIIDTGGIVVTNHHVIEPWEKSKTGLLYVKKSDGSFIKPIEIIASNKIKDIAIIRVNEANLPTINMSMNYKPELGDDVVVIGTPLGLETSVSNGIISGIRGEDGFLQITAPISAGSSGSPVMNTKGDVIGVATLVMRGGQNLNFAVPVSYVQELLLQHKNNNIIVPATAPMDATEESANLAKKIRGTVLIKTDNGGYTYIKCDVNGKDMWIAMPEVSVNVGQTIEFPEVEPLINFESKSLRMKFDQISFVPGVWIIKNNVVSKSVEKELLSDLIKHTDKNDHEGAIQILTELIDLNPKNAKYYHQRGDIYLLLRKVYNDDSSAESGEFDNSGICRSALDDFNKAITLDSNVESYYSSRASLLTDIFFCKMNSYQQAIKDYETLISMNPKNHTYYKAVGDIHLELKNYPKALECANKIIKLMPKNESGYYLLGDYFSALNNYNKALENYKKGMLLDDFPIYGQISVISITDKTSKYYDVIKLLTDVIKQKPNKYSVYKTRASLYMKTKEYKKAIEDYNIVISNTSASSSNYYNRAYSNYELGNKFIALEDFKKACELGDTAACEYVPIVEADIKRGNKWGHISSSSVQSFYYDKETLINKSGNVSAWLRIEVNDKDAYIKQKDIPEYDLEKYKNVSHSINKVDIDCNSHKIRTTGSYTYNEDGNQINNFSSENARFSNVVPDSIGSQIESTLCSMTTRKKTSNKIVEKKGTKK